MMLQLLRYLTAGGSSQQTSKLRASANARGQNRKSRFSVTNGRGADSAFSDLLSEGASPASAGGGGSSAGGGCNRARVGAAAPKQCVVCTW